MKGPKPAPIVAALMVMVAQRSPPRHCARKVLEKSKQVAGVTVRYKGGHAPDGYDPRKPTRRFWPSAAVQQTMNTVDNILNRNFRTGG